VLKLGRTSREGRRRKTPRRTSSGGLCSRTEHLCGRDGQRRRKNRLQGKFHSFMPEEFFWLKNESTLELGGGSARPRGGAGKAVSIRGNWEECKMGAEIGKEGVRWKGGKGTRR